MCVSVYACICVCMYVCAGILCNQSINLSNIRLLIRRITHLIQTRAGFTDELGGVKAIRMMYACMYIPHLRNSSMCSFVCLHAIISSIVFSLLA